jgi:hypothetical protein
LCSSSACADSANNARTDTNGTTTLNRLDALILGTPLLSQTVKGKTRTFALTGAGRNIADELDGHCLVTNQ